ncbi:hypothetical protein RhiirA4_416669 [Rhizophagus irregularis]|uniref:Uncharacterized protein n=1 Tax=Rhizophagus irregularis TaxID=588596 RepID=A0A2I1G4D9_9GLOM|nr:hypothetical protein RhiirA4_416669 [Rhizophagus irregularis]
MADILFNNLSAADTIIDPTTGLSSPRQVFSLLGLLLGSFSLRLIPLGLSSLCQGFSLLGLSLDPFSLRLHLGLSSLCQGLLFIRPSLRSFSLRFPLGVWVGSVGVWVGRVGWKSVGWESGLGECGLGVWAGSVGLCVGWECGLGVWAGSVGLSSLCLIRMYDFVVAVIETPVPLKKCQESSTNSRYLKKIWSSKIKYKDKLDVTNNKHDSI